MTMTTRPSLAYRAGGLLLGLALLAGCASTEMSNRKIYEGGPLPKPARIIVYDFAATPVDIPAWSEAAKAYTEGSPTMRPEDLETGRKLGADVAEQLVEKINKTGMTAVRAEGQPDPDLNDIVLIGYFTTVDEGSTAKRMMIGFGQGAANVGAHAEGYHMTETGLELLGSGDANSAGGKSPGLVVPVLVTIATANPIGLVVSGGIKVAGEVSGNSGAEGSAGRIADEIAEILEKRFEEQGWI